VQYPDGAEAAHNQMQFTARVERCFGQRSQGCQVVDPAHLTGGIALTEELLEPVQIGRPVGKVTTPTHAQGLVDRLLEAKVGLLDVAVLVRFAGRVGTRVHPIMGH